MKDKDITIDIENNGRSFWIRITHKSTGERVTGTGKSSWNLKRDLKKELEGRLNELKQIEGKGND